MAGHGCRVHLSVLVEVSGRHRFPTEFFLKFRRISATTSSSVIRRLSFPWADSSAKTMGRRLATELVANRQTDGESPTMTPLSAGQRHLV